jgi:predicted Zn-dependent protease
MAALLAVTVFAPATMARAQSSSQDIGRQMEKEYGVVGTDTREGQEVNALMDRTVERILQGVNKNKKKKKSFELKSAKILGGRSAKHDKIINAFALPDGRIYVTLGLIRALENSSMPEDELGFVVGHEVTHVTDKHSANQQGKAVQAGLLSILLGAVTRNKTIAQAAGVGATAYVSSFGRKDEYNADRGGLIAMSKTGYDLDAAVSMLRRLQSKGEEQNKTVNGWFGSHPLTSTRIEKMQEMIADLKAGRSPNPDDDNSEERAEKRALRRRERQNLR